MRHQHLLNHPQTTDTGGDEPKPRKLQISIDMKESEIKEATHQCDGEHIEV
jgi:hypothetical protein